MSKRFPHQATELRLLLKSGSRPELADNCADERAELLTAIEQHVLPRIALAHAVKTPSMLDCPGARVPPTHAEVVELVQLAVGQNLTAALDLVEKMSREGLGFETLMVEFIGAAARQLGDDWLEDDRTFSDVTLGLGTLHQMVEVLGPMATPPSQHRGLVVLLSPKEEQHTLGVYLLAELLRREGWGVHVDPRLAENELIDLLGREPVVMVGVAVSNDGLVEAVRGLVKRVREASRNPDISVVLGGAAESLPTLAKTVGAQYCATFREVVTLLQPRG